MIILIREYFTNTYMFTVFLPIYKRMDFNFPEHIILFQMK